MAGRYLITGVQLGMIKGLASASKMKDITMLVNKIIKEQYIGVSEEDIKKDIKTYKTKLNTR